MSFPSLRESAKRDDIIAAYGTTARIFLKNRNEVGAFLLENVAEVEKESRKWDVDLAMERFEIERTFPLRSTDAASKRMGRVA